jgi:hypothetical protein
MEVWKGWMEEEHQCRIEDDKRHGKRNEQN